MRNYGHNLVRRLGVLSTPKSVHINLHFNRQCAAGIHDHNIILKK